MYSVRDHLLDRVYSCKIMDMHEQIAHSRERYQRVFFEIWRTPAREAVRLIGCTEPAAHERK